jgi:Na+-transporting NADH:ubiquinone oxidoreductase subunit NqrE
MRRVDRLDVELFAIAALAALPPATIFGLGGALWSVAIAAIVILTRPAYREQPRIWRALGVAFLVSLAALVYVVASGLQELPPPGA